METFLDNISSTAWGSICSLLILGIVFLFSVYTRSVKASAKALADVHKAHDETLKELHASQDARIDEAFKMFSEMSSDSMAQLKDLAATLESNKEASLRIDARLERMAERGT